MSKEKSCEASLFCEGRTADGKVVQFLCSEEDVPEIKKAISKVRRLEPVINHVVSVSHGAYGKYSRYEIKQHKYAGGGYPGSGGYWEALEIINPPSGQFGFVYYQFFSGDDIDSFFCEFNTLENLLAATERYHISPRKPMEKMRGFLRRVECGLLTPWFYAVGDQELIRDYVFPAHLADDPVFKFGAKFLVPTEDDLWVIKTCLGARHVERREGLFDASWDLKKNKDINYYRLVFWHDGTCWNENKSMHKPIPRPLAGRDLWVAEAIDEFEKLLAGGQTSFCLNFVDEKKLIVNLTQNDIEVTQWPEGKYEATVVFKNHQPTKGEFEFKPTADCPTPMKFIKGKFKKDGKDVIRMEVKKKRIKRGGKKWSGVYYSLSE